MLKMMVLSKNDWWLFAFVVMSNVNAVSDVIIGCVVVVVVAVVVGSVVGVAVVFVVVVDVVLEFLLL